MKTKNVLFENGANEGTAKMIINMLKNEFGYREKEILLNLKSVEQNKEVPEGYTIYRFYNKNGEGFEAGSTPTGYRVTL